MESSREESAGGPSEVTPPQGALRRPARVRKHKHLRPRPLLALAARAGFRLGSLLPRPVARALAALAGSVLHLLPTRESLATRVNLALCFPELPERERRLLERLSLVETARGMLDLCGVWHWPLERVEALVEDVRGEEHLRAALEQGRGVLLAGPHAGMWELCSLYFCRRYPLTALYRPPRVRELEEVYRTSRARFGSELVPAGAGGVRALHRALSRNTLACILPDQDPGAGEGIFVPFFGVLANTSVLFARIAARTRAPVLMCWSERLEDGRYRLHLEPPRPGVGSDDIELSTRALNASVEAIVRRSPAQYLWSYKRFRVRPPGEPDLYRRGAR